MRVERTKEEIEELIENEWREDIRIEFKSSCLLKNNNNKIANDLTKEISGLANSEGGEIFIGIEEESRHKEESIAEKVVPINIGDKKPQQVEQIVCSNISPFLANLRCYPIFWGKDEYVLVIDVPKGNTAYQASDKIYYGRNTYSSIPMLDNEIRLRMNQGRVPTANFNIVPKIIGKELDIDFFIKNTSDVTIESFLLEVSYKGKTSQYIFPPETRSNKRTLKTLTKKLFPQQNMSLEGIPIGGITKEELVEKTLENLYWTIYLDDTRPSSGKINLNDVKEQLNTIAQKKMREELMGSD